ncbi:MAG: hypothetical protein JW956_07970 [Calditrichaceae bacterium]|nr:hypothetical protein [Calditrichaceae bacterium]
MEVKTKSYLMITATLILGIIIGIVGSGMFRNYVFEKRMEKFRSRLGFIEHMEKIIQPEPSQKDILREKLVSQQQQFTELSMQFRAKMDSLNNEFKKDLDNILTDEQQERLDKSFERFKSRYGDKQKHYPPPPPQELK